MSNSSTLMLDKMHGVHDKSQAMGEFIDWLAEEKGLHLGRFHEHADECYRGSNGRLCRSEQCGMTEGALYHRHETIEQLLADFFDIDLRQAERERMAILEDLAGRRHERRGSDENR